MVRGAGLGALLWACGGEPLTPCRSTTLAEIDLPAKSVVAGATEALSVDLLSEAGGETWARTSTGLRLIDETGAFSEPLADSLERFALGDIDGDGDIDLAGFLGSTIALFERTGPRSLVRRVDIETFQEGIDGLLAEVDGDSHLDILFSQAGGLWALLGDGDFGFQVTDQRGNRAENVTWFGAPDADGDGRVDFLVLSSPQTEVSELSARFWAGRGDGLFDEPVPSPLGVSGVTATGSRLVDVDQDRISDIVLRVDRELLVAAGRGDGTFAPPATLTAELEHPGLAARLVESSVAGDGSVDLVAVDDQAVAIVTRDPSGEIRVRSAPLPGDDEAIEIESIALAATSASSPVIRLAVTEHVCPVL